MFTPLGDLSGGGKSRKVRFLAIVYIRALDAIQQKQEAEAKRVAEGP